MAPFTYFALVIALVGSALAAPTPASSETLLEKRITHSGRVRLLPLVGLPRYSQVATQGTFFEVGLGACGKVNKDSDHIVAISSSIFGSGGNCDQVCHDALCSVQVRVG